MSIGLGCAGRLRVCLLPTSRKLCADSVGTSQKGRWKVTLAVVSTFIILLVCCAAESPVKAPTTASRVASAYCARADILSQVLASALAKVERNSDITNLLSSGRGI